jgi:2-iminobutanoate/2-iminopropanoate deaminase
LIINKQTKNFGMPWEKEYGYAQAVKVGDTIYVSGQVSHDETGKIVGRGDYYTRQ